VAITSGPCNGATFANNRHLPGDEVWLVGEWRTSGERKYYLSNLPPRTSRRAGGRDQGTLGLRAGTSATETGTWPHFEGRSWTGLHRHALMTCIAFACLQHVRLAGPGSAGRGENTRPRSGTATIAQPADPASRHYPAAVRAACGLGPMSPLPAPVQART